MDRDRYRAPEVGTVEREAGNRAAFNYFLPAHIPTSVAYSEDLTSALSGADSALGHLQGLSKLIRDPDLLIGPFMRREAVASSRIEGTKTTFEDLMRSEEVEDERDEDVNEVENYLAANELGLKLLKELPITQRFICKLHEVLMAGVRGAEKLPGELRSSPVWIGAGTHNLNSARYVAPIPKHLPDLLNDWEYFVNTPGTMPPLIRCALMHYQFETIHPFLDGNGRIGRLLIGLMLIQEKRLTRPVLYLSGYFERHRGEYYDRLQAVREEGAIEEWLIFFLRAVQGAAEDAVWRAGELVELREQYLAATHSDRSRVSALVPLIFRNPFLTALAVERATGLSDQGARNLLARAEELGWLERSGTFGRGRRMLWRANEVLDILVATRPTDDETHEDPPEPPRPIETTESGATP